MIFCLAVFYVPSLCLYVCLSVCLFFCVPSCVCLCLSVCVCIPVCLCFYASVCFCMSLLVSVCVSLFLCLSHMSLFSFSPSLCLSVPSHPLPTLIEGCALGRVPSRQPPSVAPCVTRKVAARCRQNRFTSCL